MFSKYFKIKIANLLGVCLVLAMALGACTTAGPGAQQVATAPVSSITAAPGVAVIMVSTDPKLGPILVDQKGLTLYQFKLDTAGVSNCLSTCGATWPPVYSKGTPVNGSPSQLTGKIDLITRPDGSQQVTYKGLPLYNFTLDTKPGDSSGNGYGGNWSVVKP